jgi:hypothetical protein
MAANVDQLSKSIDRLRLPTLPTYRAPIQDNTTEVQPLRLHALPTELLHNVFERLDLEDVLMMRHTCTIMARIGLHHFGSEVPLVTRRDKFRALTEIARHPFLASRMKSLFYVIDRLTPPDYDTWPYVRPHFEGDRWNSMTDAESEAFKASCADQEDVVKTGYDIDCLKQLFSGCPNIREVTVAYEEYSRRVLNALYEPYEAYFTKRGKALAWADTGARQVLNIADAAASSGVKLDSLTLAGAPYQLWDPELRYEEEVESMRGLVRPLRTLRLYIQNERDIEDIEDPDEDDPPYTDEDRYADREADEVFEMGSITEMLAEVANLRVLRLRLWHRIAFCKVTANIENALGDIHFTHLHYLAISNCTAEPRYLVKAILRHKTTLRRLSLSNIFLLGTSPGDGWISVLSTIVGQLPNLQKFSLSGYLKSMGSQDFDLQCPETRPQRADVEDFVLKGGASPWNDCNRLLEEKLRRWASERTYRNGRYVDDAELREI